MAINVLMTTDKNYILQAKITIYSVCKNTDSNNELVFTILCNKDLDKESRKYLVSMEGKFSNLSVNFYEVDEKDFVNASSNYRVPIASYYRLICPKILKVEKAIFLDSDLLVGLDIAELYAVDIDNYYVGGVRDLTPVMSPNFALCYSEKHNIKNFYDYINCGVLLMNLELMRKENIVEIFLSELKEENLWLDQDIINRVCSGKIRLIDWKFNHVAYYTDTDYIWNYKNCRKDTDREIIHFCGPDKPWGNRFLNWADAWWDVAKEVLEKDIYEKMYRFASIGYGSEKMSEIINKCLEMNKIVIVGYSDHGMFIRNALLKYGIKAELLFCDNNPKKRKLCLIDGEIYSPEQIAKEYKGAIWINAVQEHRNQIIEQLIGLGVPHESIVNFYY